MNKKAIVVGAGIAGLSVAYKLAERECDVIIFELEPSVGGLAGNVERRGAFFDFGPHTFFLKDDLKEEFYRIIDFNEVYRFKTNAKIKFGNKYYHYPLDAFDILSKTNPIVTMQCLIDYFIAKLKMKTNSSKEESAESWIINRFGKTLYKIYFEKYTEKVWGLHPKFIAPSFTEERIPLLNLRETVKITVTKLIKRLFKIKEATKSPYLVWGHYPKNGPSAFFKKMVGKITTNKGTICLNSPIKCIRVVDNKVTTISFEKNEDQQKIECDYLISTIPINSLIKLIKPSPNIEVLNAGNSLKFRATVFANLLVKKTNVLEARMIYFRNKTFNRISEINKFSKDIVPEGLTGLCAEITCDKGDTIWRADEQQLCDKVVKELEEEKLIAKDDVVDAFVTRKEHGYPVADLNYEKNRKLLYGYIKSIENLFSTGRQGLFRYLQMDHCMKMGFALTNHILSGKHKSSSYSDIDKLDFI